MGRRVSQKLSKTKRPSNTAKRGQTGALRQGLKLPPSPSPASGTGVSLLTLGNLQGRKTSGGWSVSHLQKHNVHPSRRSARAFKGPTGPSVSAKQEGTTLRRVPPPLARAKVAPPLARATRAVLSPAHGIGAARSSRLLATSAAARTCSSVSWSAMVACVCLSGKGVTKVRARKSFAFCWKTGRI